MRAIIADVRAQTRALLTERADRLEALAQALLAKEVLNENDLREVLGPRPYKKPEHIPGVTAEGEPAGPVDGDSVSDDGHDLRRGTRRRAAAFGGDGAADRPAHRHDAVCSGGRLI